MVALSYLYSPVRLLKPLLSFSVFWLLFPFGFSVSPHTTYSGKCLKGNCSTECWAYLNTSLLSGILISSCFDSSLMLSNKYISYPELCLLEKIAHVLDLYLNSGLCGFLTSSRLKNLFGVGAFDFYCGFARWLNTQRFFDVLHSTVSLYNGLQVVSTWDKLAEIELLIITFNLNKCSHIAFK